MKLYKYTFTLHNDKAFTTYAHSINGARVNFYKHFPGGSYKHLEVEES